MLWRNPITGIAGCWARTANGQATATPRSAINSRRLIRSPRRRGRGQILSNLRQEPARADGLGHVGIATHRTRLVLSLIQLISCDGNDGYSAQRRVGFEATGCLITVEPRQLDIHYNEVRAVGSRRGKP